MIRVVERNLFLCLCFVNKKLGEAAVRRANEQEKKQVARFCTKILSINSHVQRRGCLLR